MNLVLQSFCRNIEALPRLLSHRRPRRPSPAVQTPQVSVVIVNYCQWPDTAGLVRQLLAAPAVHRGRAEVVVVDNHSPPHPLAARLRRWPGVSLRRWRRNRGFARAVNEGCRLSRGQWLLLLNPDVTIPTGFLDGILELTDRLAQEEPRAGIVGLRLYNSDGTPQPSSGPFPTLAGTLARMLLPRTWRKYHPRGARRRCRVPWVTGCCLLLRRDCLQELGGLDPDFFLYYEDVDLCRRARARGWSVWFEPSLGVIHHNPLHRRAVPPHLRLFTRHALLTYGSKHWPRWQFQVLAGIVRIEARLRQWWTGWRGDERAAALFGELRAIAADLAGRRRTAARRRLNRVVRQEEERLAGRPVDCHSVAPSS
ncbi:MAG TPA: glycosyltransferase family 2 protein [Gemmataceae bacterium]|nr:glycosyltransferase family 2 protein [Gemmataceae bacterium]